MHNLYLQDHLREVATLTTKVTATRAILLMPTGPKHTMPGVSAPANASRHDTNRPRVAVNHNTGPAFTMPDSVGERQVHECLLLQYYFSTTSICADCWTWFCHADTLLYAMADRISFLKRMMIYDNYDLPLRAGQEARAYEGNRVRPPPLPHQALLGSTVCSHEWRSLLFECRQPCNMTNHACVHFILASAGSYVRRIAYHGYLDRHDASCAGLARRLLQ